MQKTYKEHNERITGIVERVTFHNSENGFCVIKVKVYNKKDLVTVIGSSPSILTGEYVECVGQWLMSKEHGLQFRTDILKSTAPTSIEGIEKYLASGLIKGIGPVYARKLVEAFGDDIFNVTKEFNIYSYNKGKKASNNCRAEEGFKHGSRKKSSVNRYLLLRKKLDELLIWN